VESNVLQSNLAFAVIFALQALMIIICWLAVRGVTIEGLQAKAEALTGSGNRQGLQTETQ
jgi:BCD family chlorophyll transporter-like MFS transporter